MRYSNRVSVEYQVRCHCTMWLAQVVKWIEELTHKAVSWFPGTLATIFLVNFANAMQNEHKVAVYSSSL